MKEGATALALGQRGKVGLYCVLSLNEQLREREGKDRER